MGESEALPVRVMLGMVAMTLVSAGVIGLGLYALYQAWIQERAIHLVQAVMPLFLGGWFFIVSVRFWAAIVQRRRSRAGGE